MYGKEHRQWTASRQMVMAFVIWLATSGSGALIGMIAIIIPDRLSGIQPARIQEFIAFCAAGRGSTIKLPSACRTATSTLPRPRPSLWGFVALRHEVTSC